MPLISFYIHCKHQKTSAFLIFSGVSKEISGMKWVKTNKYLKIDKYFTALLLYRCQNDILRSETTINSSSKKNFCTERIFGKSSFFSEVSSSCISRGFQTSVYRFGPPNYMSKTVQNNINYLIISSTQTLPHFLRHLL